MSLLPANYTMTCWEGSTFRKTITVLTGDVGSAVQNLTGYSAVMNIRTASDAQPVYTLSTANSQITLGGTGGTVSLYIPAADTLTFDAWEGSGLYDLSITAPGPGDTTTLLWGPFRVQGLA